MLGTLSVKALTENLFSMPSYSQSCSFGEALEKGRKEEKFLLVNIQTKEEFASHTLNRDIWNNDLISMMVQENFIFWQRDDKSQEGAQFLTYVI